MREPNVLRRMPSDSWLYVTTASHEGTETRHAEPSSLSFTLRSGSSSAKTRLCSPKPNAAAFAQRLEADVEHRDHEDPDGARGNHPGEDWCSHVVTADLGCTLRDDQWVDSQNERKRSHHDGTKPHLRAEYCGFPNILAHL